MLSTASAPILPGSSHGMKRSATIASKAVATPSTAKKPARTHRRRPSRSAMKRHFEIIDGFPRSSDLTTPYRRGRSGAVPGSHPGDGGGFRA